MAHRSFNSARRSAYTLNARIRTNEGHTATRRAQAQHNKGEAFTASEDDGYLPLNRPHLTSLFGAVLAHADQFDSEFHDRNLPSSTSTDSRSLASLRLKRFGSKGPYCSNRRSMLLHPSRVSRSRSHVRAGGSACVQASIWMIASTDAGS